MSEWLTASPPLAHHLPTMRQQLRSPVLLLSLLLALPLGRAFGQEMDARLNTFFQSYLDKAFLLEPLSATQLGDHRFDHLLEDLSPAGLAERKRLWQSTLKSLPRTIDRVRLSKDGQIDYDILRDELARSIWLAENTRPYQEDPRVYNTYISDSVYLLLAQSTLPRETNVANCIARMKQIPKVIAAAKLNLKNPPRVHTETAIRQNKGAISFYEKDLFDFAGETAQLPALKAAAAQVVTELKAYQQFLEQDLLPRAHGNWRIGSKRFGKKLDMVLDANISADQLLAQAESEFDRVQRDMYVVARQLWSRYFPKQALPPDDAAGRRETVRLVLGKVAQDHGKPEDLVRDVKQTVAQIKQFITDRDILRLPDPDTCQIVEMPEFQRGNSTAYMNSPPPLDPKAAGYYAVSPPPADWDAQKVKSYLEEYNSYMLQILTIHEAYPGHYVQLEYSNRNPSPIRRVLQSGVYIEGWAVYTEQTMLDQGYGDGNLPLRLTQLKFYLRAVVNAILDHRMHCDSMTDDEAMKLLTEDAYQSEGEARLKVIRAKQSSVQLSTYFAGRMAMYRTRQAIEREQGADFQLGRYHEAVLVHGPVPVKVLPNLVRERLKEPR
jgi:uncharacterized protein (DUF885 family)